MALQTATKIFISGTPILSYVSLKLVQEIDAHHDLELVCRTDVVERLSNELIGESKEYLGGIITLKIASVGALELYKELEFKGIVTKVSGTKGFHQSTGDLVTIYAKSTSILSDDGSHYASFSDMGLQEILEQTFQGYDAGKLETSFSAASTNTIHYSVQHNQSAFSYASRLAAYNNEWFYYDGSKLIFGRPSKEEIELKYGVDLQEFSVELSSVPNSFDYFTVDYTTDQLHEKSSEEISIPSEGYHGFTNTKSKEIYAKKTNVLHNLYIDSNLKSRLDKQVENYTQSRAMKQVLAKGISDNPGINLGEVVMIKGYGRYRVIKITHSNIEGGVYKNEFEAVDANFDTYPKMDIECFPKSEVQVATVIENNDPEGMSRIKVQFPWQKTKGVSTPWLQMTTLYAGGDKGMHFLPEVGESVLVGFENGNAERPFVQGAIYTGTKNHAAWQSQNNDYKGIQTKSGHIIELNDTKDGEMITITDKNSNIIRIDTANNNIEISALENMTLNAKNIEINATEEIKMNAGMNMITRVTEDLSVNAKNSTEMVEENKTMVAKEILENAEKFRIESSKENMELVSSKMVDIQANDNIKLF